MKRFSVIVTFLVALAIYTSTPVVSAQPAEVTVVDPVTIIHGASSIELDMIGKDYTIHFVRYQSSVMADGKVYTVLDVSGGWIKLRRKDTYPQYVVITHRENIKRLLRVEP